MTQDERARLEREDQMDKRLARLDAERVRQDRIYTGICWLADQQWELVDWEPAAIAANLRDVTEASAADVFLAWIAAGLVTGPTGVWHVDELDKRLDAKLIAHLLSGQSDRELLAALRRELDRAGWPYHLSDAEATARWGLAATK